jgi:hypothetical protein
LETLSCLMVVCSSWMRCSTAVMSVVIFVVTLRRCVRLGGIQELQTTIKQLKVSKADASAQVDEMKALKQTLAAAKNCSTAVMSVVIFVVTLRRCVRLGGVKDARTSCLRVSLCSRHHDS